MKYEPKFPKCTYRMKGGIGCSNKLVNGDCPYKDPQKPDRCEKYQEHIKGNKMDSKAVSDNLRAIGVLTND